MSKNYAKDQILDRVTGGSGNIEAASRRPETPGNLSDATTLVQSESSSEDGHSSSSEGDDCNNPGVTEEGAARGEEAAGGEAAGQEEDAEGGETTGQGEEAGAEPQQENAAPPQIHQVTLRIEENPQRSSSEQTPLTILRRTPLNRSNNDMSMLPGTGSSSGTGVASGTSSSSGTCIAGPSAMQQMVSADASSSPVPSIYVPPQKRQRITWVQHDGPGPLSQAAPQLTGVNPKGDQHGDQSENNIPGRSPYVRLSLLVLANLLLVLPNFILYYYYQLLASEALTQMPAMSFLFLLLSHSYLQLARLIFTWRTMEDTNAMTPTARTLLVLFYAQLFSLIGYVASIAMEITLATTILFLQVMVALIECWLSLVE